MKFRALFFVLAAVLLPASASFAQWEAADSANTPAQAQGFAPQNKAMSDYQRMMIHDYAERGSRLYTAGFIATGVGFVGFWAGFFTGVGGNLGLLAMTAGIPFMGIGSGMVQDAAQTANPEFHGAGGLGWPLYAVGVGANIASIVVLASNLKKEDGDYYIAPGPAITALSLAAAGQLLYYASWYEFSHRRSIARMNIASSVSVVPAPYLARNRVLPGADLVVRF